MNNLENYLGRILSADLGKLILRFALGFLMIFHGYKKAMVGITGIEGLVVKEGFPAFLAYGVYLGEIIIPLLLIIGLYTRISSLIFAVTMGFAIYLAHFSQLLEINNNTGGLVIELPLLYMLCAIALMFIGAGKYSFDKK